MELRNLCSKQILYLQAGNMLHIIAISANKNLVDSCLQLVAADPHPALLLYQEAVNLAVENSEFAGQLLALAKKIPLYAVEQDVIARGITAMLIPAIKLISYGEFVNLTIQHNKTISW